MTPDNTEQRKRWGRGEPAVGLTNCPFYGHHFVYMGHPFLLLNSEGNECAIMIGGYHPCLFTRAEEIDWRTCPVVKAIRMSLSAMTNPHEPDDRQ